MPNDLDSIKHTLKQWVAAINSRRAGSVLKLVSDDVVFSQPPAVRFTGKAAIARLYHAAFRTYHVRQRLQYEDIRIVGRLATVRATEHMTLKPRSGGQAVGFIENDAMRFRRQADGAWKLVSRSLTTPSPLLSIFAPVARARLHPIVTPRGD